MGATALGAVSMKMQKKAGDMDDMILALQDSSGIADQRSSIRQKNERIILSSAEVVFAKESYNGATIENIARRANLPRANVMYYFKSKRHLYQRVLYDMCLAWEGPANEFTIYSDPKTAMKTYIKAKMDLARDRPFGSKVWVSEVLRGAEMVDEYLRDHLADWLESRSDVIRHWITKGLIKPIEPRTLFFSIWATTQHYADFSDQLCILNGDKPYSDKQYAKITRDLTKMYLRSLGID